MARLSSAQACRLAGGLLSLCRMTGSGKTGGSKGDPKRAARLAAALRDNLKRRKAQMKARVRAAPKTADHDSGGITPEIARNRPKR